MSATVQQIPSERQRLFDAFQPKLETAFHLDRRLVSFQANKSEPFFRWFKYKEGFSSALVRCLLETYAPRPGKLLDPFAGAGTSLFAARELGWEAHGIELLPVGAFAIKARESFEKIDHSVLKKMIDEYLCDYSPIGRDIAQFKHLTITRNAFPTDNENDLNEYLSFCSRIIDADLRRVLKFAAFAVLEEISYTRKDGQYLRWDHRSPRILKGKPFDKGRIYSFKESLYNKVLQLADDGSFVDTLLPFDFGSNGSSALGSISLRVGSCLEHLPRYASEEFDFVITSPPYCNRYDYTRTYALELAFLGFGDQEVRELRQKMLSCTVENKEKIASLGEMYQAANRGSVFESVLTVYDRCRAMSEINSVLDALVKQDRLNNKNIARMVRNYFLEMCFVISELARVTRSGGYCVIINDNVRYGGEEIPVDLILSEFAQSFGYSVEKIFVLPRGKGNSSQQMGAFGRTEVRKCVYLWRKE